MDYYKIIIILSFIYFSSQQLNNPSGNFCSQTVERINYTTVCNCFNLFWCCGYENITELYNDTEYSCCTGWTHNGDENCSIPICTSSCQNGGQCVSPDTCRCTAGYEGSTCGSVSLCSHLSPCYPGDCSGNPKQCICSNGFSGSSCLQFGNAHTPFLLQSNSSLSFFNTTSNNIAYSYMVDSLTNNSITWSNQKTYNKLDFSLLASFSQSAFGTLPGLPSYIKDVTYGVVAGQILFTYTTTAGDSSFTLTCPDVGNTNPLQLLTCYLRQDNTITIQSGESFTLTFGTTSGGNRRLLNTDDNSVTGSEFYSGRSVQNILQFKFDFDVPVHCTQTSGCADNPMSMTEDVTMTAIRPMWSGWTDALSGVYRYSFEIWKMEYVVSDDGLREPIITDSSNPEPIYITEILAESLTFPQYTPNEPGVYSCILEVNDKANNSEYVRRIVIFDDTSEITVNASNRLFIPTASMDTDYLWQTSYNLDGITDITVVWGGLFSNEFHDQNNFLSKVLDYEPRLSDNIWRYNYKRILAGFNDNEGERTVNAISHIRGIVKYEMAHEIISKPKTEVPSMGWVEVSPLADTTSFQMASRTIGDGDSHQIWIRASDVRKVNKTETVVIHFDQTGPQIYLTGVQFNTNTGGNPFSSSISVISQDQHSGVKNASFKLVLNQTGEVKYSTESVIAQETEADCSTTPDCYCVPMGNCFIRTISFNFDNCLLAVPLEFVSNGTYDLQITSYNAALLSSYQSLHIGFVSSFNGINEYPSPSSLTFVNKTNSAVTVQWTNVNTCYQRLRFIIYLYNPDNSSRMFDIDKDLTVFTISELSPGDTYKLEIFTEYGNETYVGRSPVPLNVTFMTAPFCSHLQPCYPGHCMIDSDDCNCTNGFSGTSCLQFDALYTPLILRYNSSLSFGDSMTGLDLYKYTTGTDQSFVNNLTWSNQEDFDTLEIVLDALFDQTQTFGILPDLPNYVGNISLGIVEGMIQISHVSSTGISNTMMQCPSVSGTHPVKDLNCIIENSQARKFSSGDLLSLTFNVTSGGNRELIKINDGALMSVEFYNGQSIQSYLEFKFDFDVPVHCIQTSSCSDSPMELMEDVTKSGIRTFWSGWMDSLSGVQRYSFEIWKLEYILDDDGLREPLITNSSNPEPLFIAEIPANNLIFPEYQPTEPGVYSCILEINDKANNSEYVRRIVIYDDTSDITVNVSQRLIVTSATSHTNYLWQTSYNSVDVTSIELSWQGLFENSLHHQRHFLSKVLNYEPRLSDNIRRHNYKRILSVFDDSEGGRQTDAILNINGIISFHVHYTSVVSQQSQIPLDGWIEVLPISENTSVPIAANDIADGVTYQVWIRASDILNNSKTEKTIVHFDKSGPEIILSNVNYNANGIHMFTSRFMIIVKDAHSGLLNTTVQLILNSTNEIRFQTYITNYTLTSEECSQTSDCYCVPMGDCFIQTSVIDVNTCLLGVQQDLIASGSYILKITSTNVATLVTTSETELKITDFIGINDYSSPSNVAVVNKTNSEVTIHWSSISTCYKKVRFVIFLHHPDNSTAKFDIDTDIDVLTFTGLTPGETYNIDLYTEYGNDTDFVRSLEPSQLTVTTASFCSHLRPCFPGHCKTDIDDCICTNDFTGDSCQSFDMRYLPVLKQSNSTLSYREANRDVYFYTASSTSNITWSNQEDFNMLEFFVAASFDTNETIGLIPDYPNYIRDVQFGVVEGLVVFNHTSQSAGINSTTLKCQDVSDVLPVAELQCNIVLSRHMNLQSGDRFEIKFIIESGGKRELINIGDGSTAGIEFYNGQSVYEVLDFRFDFDVPIHCIQTSSCSNNPLSLDKDVTKTAIRPAWFGWTDQLSGIYKYAFEIWKMEYVSSEDGLREPLITNSSNPKPLFIADIPSNSVIFPEYQPVEPGVYSCILHVNDVANNSEYVRRIVIYDDTSDIAVNTSQRLIVTSATPQTNFLWQTNYSSNDVSTISLTWNGLFANILHEQGNFLSKVLDYEPRLSDNIRRHNYKRILPEFDDNEGTRTINSISNIGGIVRFQLNHESVTSQKSQIPSNGWVDVSPIAENTSFELPTNTIGDGDSHQLWIRAYDILDNSKTETTIVHFDKSGPEIHFSNIDYNINGQFKFTSRFTFISRDLNSGLLNVSFQLLLNGTTEATYESNKSITTEADCSRSPTNCYCVPMGDCFMQTITFDVNNCLLGVPLDLIENDIYIVHVTSTNVALLMTTMSFEFNVKDFSGVNEYPSPSDITFSNKSDTSVTVQWTDVPTCYQLSGYVLYLYQPNNSTKMFSVDSNQTKFVINQLSPGLTYGLEMFTVYVVESALYRSPQPLNVTFDTSEADISTASASLNLIAIIVPSLLALIILTVIGIIVIRKMEKRRQKNKSIKQSPDQQFKKPILVRTPTLTRSKTGSMLSIPERPSLEKANSKLRTDIFSINLPKGRANTLPPLPPLSSKMNGSVK